MTFLQNRVLGIALSVIGLLFVLINYFSIRWENVYFPKLLMSGIITLALGIGFILFPGGAVNMQGEADRFWKLKWQRSSALDKCMWLVFLLAGAGCAIFVLVHFNLSIA